ncbi:MAG: SMC-Scp complex subunit ScpB [Gammaproteobacteria bacterium]|jgi:segregation and condensation protein B
MSELTELKRIIEGAILASESPLTIDNLESLFIVESPTRSEIRDAIAEIEADCESRGFELKKVATGYRFQVKEKYSEWVSRLWEERAPRYTRALLETLALIAYKQPITRGDIEEIRGVAVSTNIIRTLLEREWVRVVGHRDVPGRPAMYATTKHFLDYFNVASLEELPTLQEIKDIAAEEASLAIEEPLIEMTSIELEPEDLELEGANETDLDAVSQQVDQIQENIRQVMAPRPEERDEDWDDLESGDPRGEQSGEVSPMESEEGLPADQRADQRANDRAADPADNGEEGSDPEPDMGVDQNKDA